MKIAFDEHIPKELVKVFKALAESKRIIQGEFVHASDYTAKSDKTEYKGQTDVPWMTRFAKDGGTVVISGDRRIRSNPPERDAYQKAGIMLFCFSSQWNQKTLLTKTAMLLQWWKCIEKHIENHEPANCYEIPCKWNVDELRDVTGPKQQATKS